MRFIPILAASVLALSTSAALAQAPGALSPAPRHNAGPTAAPAPQRMPAVNPLTQDDVSKIPGTDVYGSDHKKIGEVSNVLMKPDSKSIDRLVVSQGGVLGLGAHHVALPVKDFHWDQQLGGFTIAKTGDELNKMAEWHEPGTEGGGTTAGSGSSMPPPPPPGQSTAHRGASPAH